MLFHMLDKHKNITRAVINDINPVLMYAYERIKDNPPRFLLSLFLLGGDFLGFPANRAVSYHLLRFPRNGKGVMIVVGV